MPNLHVLFRITTLVLTHRVIAMYIYFSSGIGIRRKEDLKNSLEAKISCILRWRGKNWTDIRESSGMLSSRNTAKFSAIWLKFAWWDATWIYCERKWALVDETTGHRLRVTSGREIMRSFERTESKSDNGTTRNGIKSVLTHVGVVES